MDSVQKYFKRFFWRILKIFGKSLEIFGKFSVMIGNFEKEWYLFVSVVLKKNTTWY